MKEIVDRYNRIKDLKDSLSEIDIQILLVEPILSLGGWNLFDANEVKRAGRSSTGKEFDIEVYSASNHEMKIAIECKSLNNDEFNIGHISEGIGALVRTEEKNVYRQRKSTDGVAQLRRYCIRSRSFDKACPPIPVLTNGYEWVLFNVNFHNDQNKFECNIDSSYILARATIENETFYTQIVDRLKIQAQNNGVL